MKIMSDYDTGRSDGYCGLTERHPNNFEYARGYATGLAVAQSEHYELDSYLGSNDTHSDYLN